MARRRLQRHFLAMTPISTNRRFSSLMGHPRDGDARGACAGDEPRRRCAQDFMPISTAQPFASATSPRAGRYLYFRQQTFYKDLIGWRRGREIEPR